MFNVSFINCEPGNNDSADDMKNVDLTRIHYLSGPFEVETAEPGDVLLVEIMDVQPHDKHPWGFVCFPFFKCCETIANVTADRLVSRSRSRFLIPRMCY
jgi:acetamidase/formamidase